MDTNTESAGSPAPLAPAVRTLDRYLRSAVTAGASDLHFEPDRGGLRVRIRVDGVLQSMPAPPTALVAPMLTRLRSLAGVDLARRRLPEDGRFHLESAQHGRIDVRACFVPANGGERAVLRFLRHGASALQLAELGLSADQRAQLEAALAANRGLIIAAGPTGSGKSTTLFAALARLASPERSLVTVEDPIELELPGACQIGVDEAVGRDFATVLRALLRQDPDIILVGEMRDTESARIACRAALTGHLVLSTLHTADAVEAKLRLADMGVPEHLIAATVTLVIAQRLLRRLCGQCREPRTPTPGEVRLFASVGLDAPKRLATAAGCEACAGRGYHGRFAVFEILPGEARTCRPMLAFALQRAALGDTDVVECLARCPEPREDAR